MHRLAQYLAFLAVACGADGSGTSRSVSQTNPTRDDSPSAPQASVEPTGTADEACLWEVDALLEEAGLPTEQRLNCGSSLGFDEEAFECFAEALDANTPAELTVNFCIDCSIPSTFVVTSDGALARVELEADVFADDLRTATVERCGDIVFDDGLPDCTDPVELYNCQEPLD